MSNDTLDIKIKWGAPPSAGKAGRRPGTGRTARFVSILKQRPGEWAKYPWPVRSSGTSTSNAKRYPGTEWTTRSLGKGTYEVYGRWVGLPVSPADVEAVDMHGFPES